MRRPIQAVVALAFIFAGSARANVAFQSELQYLSFATRGYKIEISLNDERRINLLRVWAKERELRVPKELYRDIFHPYLLDVRLLESAGAEGAELQIPVLICSEKGNCDKEEIWSFSISAHAVQFNQHYTSDRSIYGK